MKKSLLKILCTVLTILMISSMTTPAFADLLMPAAEGETDSDTAENETVPEKPENAGEEPPVKPDGDALSDEEPPEKPDGEASEGGDGTTPPGSGNDAGEITYTAVKEFTAGGDLMDTNVSSIGADENGILVSGGDVTLKNVAVERSNDVSTGGDNASFYGVGASVLATGGNTYIKDSAVKSNANGGAGIFSYGDANVYVSGGGVQTFYDASGGIHVAGGGTLYAWDVTAETSGQSSAAIRSDRGGGTMVVDGGSYTTNGVGSPAVYCTADISVNNASLNAKGSEAVCLEGLNTVRLYDCELSGFMADDEQNDCTWNIIVYQSMSGDSQEGCGTFQMKNGQITANNGGIFYTTNTESDFYLENVSIFCPDGCDYFLRCTGNNNKRGWGKSGSNGADCRFTTVNQIVEGNIVYDSISDLDFYLLDASKLTGAILSDESCAGKGGKGTSALHIGTDSVWVVTGNSVLTNLYNAGSVEDADGNKVTILDAEGETIVEGESEFTVTVSEYSTELNAENADTDMPEWDTIKVDMPNQLIYEEATTSAQQTIITEDKKDNVIEKVSQFYKEFKVFILAFSGAIILIIIVAIISKVKKKKY